MTAVAGFDIIAATGATAAASGTPKSGASMRGKTAPRTSALPPSATSSANNFRTGFEEMLTSLAEPASQSVKTQHPEASNSPEGSLRKTVPGKPQSSTEPSAAQATAEPPASPIQKTVAPVAPFMTKRAGTQAASTAATASSAKKADSSNAAHSTRANRHSSSKASSSGNQASLVQLAAQVPVPAAMHAVQAVSTDKAFPAKQSSATSEAAMRDTAGRTASAAVLPARGIASSAVSGSISASSSAAGAVPETQTLSAEPHAVPDTAAAQAVHTAIHADAEENPVSRADKPLRLDETSFTQTAPIDNAAKAKTANEPAPVSGNSEGVTLPSHVNGGPKLRDRSPLEHETAASSAPQPASSGASIPSGTTLLREPAGAQPAAGNTLTSATHSLPEARDTFAALDSASSPSSGQPQTTWLHAGARQAEAGYLDPSLGWVSVRADVDSSGLHASVVPSSPEAAQALSAHLAGLNSYLAEHHGNAITASLASPESFANNSQFSGNPGQGAGNGNPHGGAQQQGETQAPASIAPSVAHIPSASSAQPTDSTTITYTRTGGISVLA